MDFASLMSTTIAKTQTTPSRGVDLASIATKTKYLKRSEIEAAREAAYLAEQAAKEAERTGKAEKKRQLEEGEADRKLERDAKRQRLAEESKRLKAKEEHTLEKERRKRLGLPELPLHEGSLEQADNGDEPQQGVHGDLSEDELLAKLRSLNEPARLFAETHKQRLQRYSNLLTLNLPSANASMALPKASPDNPIPTTLMPVSEVEMKIPAVLPPESDVTARLFLSRQLTSWFTLVLREWAKALAGRTDITKKTFQGQAASNSMTQAVQHLRPLFRKLEKSPQNPSELPEDLFAPIAEIVRAAQERRYVHANDGYLQLSIGKAAWPIGVTMVGIHERSAREKLHESDKGKAHIMADEVTRKILQSIKRCLSFAQTRWPPEDLGQLMG